MRYVSSKLLLLIIIIINEYKAKENRNWTKDKLELLLASWTNMNVHLLVLTTINVHL